MRFVLDEDMPRSLGRALTSAGHDVLDVRDHGLRGRDDEDVFRFAQQNAAVLVSEDLGFANLLRFSLGTHSGIVIGRFPSKLSTTAIVKEVVSAMSMFTTEDLHGALVIIEIGRVRIRRPE